LLIIWKKFDSCWSGISSLHGMADILNNNKINTENKV